MAKARITVAQWQLLDHYATGSNDSRRQPATYLACRARGWLESDLTVRPSVCRLTEAGRAIHALGTPLPDTVRSLVTEARRDQAALERLVGRVGMRMAAYIRGCTPAEVKAALDKDWGAWGRKVRTAERLRAATLD